ncbi:hypothetical protein ACSTH7_25080, partial [Vibrio parahaemolyticus]
DPKQSQSFLAETGRIVKDGASSYLVMTNGHILRRADIKEPAQIIKFDKYGVDLERFETKVSEDTDLRP